MRARHPWSESRREGLPLCCNTASLSSCACTPPASAEAAVATLRWLPGSSFKSSASSMGAEMPPRTSVVKIEIAST